MSETRFEDQLRRILEGESRDVSFVGTAIMEDETLLTEYLDQVELDTFLNWELGSESPRFVELTPAVPTTRWPAISKPLAVAAAAVILVGVGHFLGRQHLTPAGSTAAVAVLIDSEDCKWESGPKGQHLFGSSFAAGETLRIRSGIARLALWSKAGVAITGPAEIELVSSDEVRVQYGSVNAFAPEEAIGFKLTTPDVEIVDLGTRFGTSVDPDGTTEVHVFEGEVSVQDRSAEQAKEMVTTGQARRYTSGGGQRTEIEVAPARFAEPPELEQLLAVADSDTGSVRSEAGEKMSSEPGVLAAQRFVSAEGKLNGQSGGMGFAKRPWSASPAFTRLIPRVQSHSGEASAGGHLLVRGRDKAEPFVANRLHRPLSEALPGTFFFAIEGTYVGLDEDDFFSLWIDDNEREDASHANVPTLGIREGRYFARLDLKHSSVAGTVRDNEPFVIVGCYAWKAERQRAEISLWVNPSDAEDVPPDAVCEGPVMEEPPRDYRFIGLRVGQYTEVSDRLLIHGFAVGTDLRSTLAAVRL